MEKVAIAINPKYHPKPREIKAQAASCTVCGMAVKFLLTTANHNQTNQMLTSERTTRTARLLLVADAMMTAARTAPKGKGIDII